MSNRHNRPKCNVNHWHVKTVSAQKLPPAPATSRSAATFSSISWHFPGRFWGTARGTRSRRQGTLLVESLGRFSSSSSVFAAATVSCAVHSLTWPRYSSRRRGDTSTSALLRSVNMIRLDKWVNGGMYIVQWACPHWEVRFWPNGSPGFVSQCGNAHLMFKFISIPILYYLQEVSIMARSIQPIWKLYPFFGNHFHLIWIPIQRKFPNHLETVSKRLEICFQIEWKPFPFKKSFQIKWKPLLPFWILIRGIQNGLVRAFSGEDYVVVHATKQSAPLPFSNAVV